MNDYGLAAPSSGLGLRRTPTPYQTSFASWNPKDFQAPVTQGGYGGLNFEWDSSKMPGIGFQDGSMGGYGLNANGASIATPGLTGGLGNINQPGGIFSGIGQWMKDSGFLSQRDPNTGVQTQGWGGLALGGAQALGSLYMGMKQYGLAKDTLAANKAQFERNFDAQRRTTNAALEDRQRARVASNPGAYQSVGDYMNQNEVR